MTKSNTKATVRNKVRFFPYTTCIGYVNTGGVGGLEASTGNAISEGMPPLCNTSSEAGAIDTGGTYQE